MAVRGRFDIVREVAALDEEREMSAAHGTISRAHDNAAWAQSLADEGIARRCVTDGEKVWAALLLEEGVICVAADAEDLARAREEETMQQGDDYWLGSDMAGNPGMDDGWSDVGWGADDPND
ncbi:hydroxylase [Pseudoscourfieldia marina]